MKLSPAWRTRATAAALLLPPLVHLVSLERLTRWIARRGPAPGPVAEASLAEWVDRVLERLPPPWHRTCLKRALVLLYLIRRAGGTAELHVGVRRDDAGALLAHAWLMRGGALHLEPGGSSADRFRVLARFPQPTT
jgi:hypothetical protein